MEHGAGQIFRADTDDGAEQIFRVDTEDGAGQIFQVDTPHGPDQAGSGASSINTPGGFTGLPLQGYYSVEGNPRS
ncbi:hypothetical protein Dimus_028640 [Dionaea muscipula]